MNRIPVNARPQIAAVPAQMPVVQPKLSVSVPGDKYEQEADRIADQVMRTESAPSSIQRICKECEEEQEVQRAVNDEEEEEGTTLQGKRASSDPLEAPEDFGERVANSRAGGTPLPEQTRNFFEPRFGRAFEDVRVHHGNDAASLAGSVRAKAFTVGRDIFFGLGEYAPQTERGRGLIAHELVHTVQQSGGPAVRRQGEEEATPEPEAAEGVKDMRTLEVSPDISSSVGGGAAPEQEAEVSRAANDAVLDDPEGSAHAETPYETGLSRGVLAAALGEGEPLDAATRQAFENRFGLAIPDIRLHTNGAAASLAQRFGARAFTFGRHIAFGEGTFAPHTDSGQRLLRHEMSHAVVARAAAPSSVFRACTTNCPPGTATAYSAVSSAGINCYGYATGRSSFIWPGEISGSAEAADARAVRTNSASTAADLARVLPYHSASRIRANTEADIGSRISSDCTRCCFDKRKIIEVMSGDATKFLRGVNSAGAFVEWVPIVAGTQRWDFHLYRKDADRSWSHKRGRNPSQQDDAAGATPICNPCTASRTYSVVDYTNILGSWCI